jgi:translation initiation factor IF-2
VVINDGKIGSLKRFKEDAREVKSGFECGIGVENFNDIKVGDILEAYELKEMKATLEVPGEKGERGERRFESR